MPDFTGDLGTKITAAVHGVLDAVPGIEGPILQTIKDSVASVIAAETAAIPAIGEMEKQVIDYALKEFGKLLDNQRVNLGSEIDRRFVAMGAVITAFGQALSASTEVR